MAALVKAKHEAMAQALFQGNSNADAFVAAGYSPTDANRKGWKMLKKHPEIGQRVVELRNEKSDAEEAARMKAAEISGTSRAYVMKRLHDLVERCMQSSPVYDRKGNLVYVEVPSEDGTVKLAPAYTFDSKGAARGLHLLGLEHGMFVQRIRHEDDSPFGQLLKSLPAPALKMIYEALAKMSKARTFENGSPKQLPERSLVDSGSSS